MNILSQLEQTLARNEGSNDKDKSRLKAQRETIVKLERKVKLLEQQIRKLEKDLNRPEKEAPEKILPPKKPTAAETREAARKKFADMFRKIDHRNDDID